MGTVELNNAENVVKLTESVKGRVGRPPAPLKFPSVIFPFDMDINTKTGKYTNTLDNIYKATKCHEITGIEFGYDNFLCSEVVRVNGKWEEINDNTVTDLRICLERLDMPRVPKDEARNAIYKVCTENQFDSAIDWIKTLSWDGVSRVSEFFKCYFSAIGNDAYLSAVSLYTWTALAGRVLVPGIKADMVPLIYGKQGTRKSTGIQEMTPFEDAFVEIDLTKSDDDLSRKIRGCIIAEWEELRGLSNRDSDSTKAFITSKIDKWVPKFKEFKTSNPRRTLIIGTTNKKEILIDQTGNRRYLPLMAGSVDVEKIKNNKDQLWAEAFVLFNSNGVMWEQAQELAQAEHENYLVVDPWEDDLVDYLEINTNNQVQFASTEALFSRIGLVVGRTNRNHAERLKSIMSRLGYSYGQRRINKQTKRGYFLG